MRQVALDDRQIFAEPIKLAQMLLDSETLILWQDLFPDPGPSFGAAQVRSRARRGMQDRLDDVLQFRTLANDLIAPGDLPPTDLRRFIRDPNFPKKAAGVELHQHAGVDGVHLNFGVGDHPHLDGIGDRDPLHMAADHARDRRGIAGLRAIWLWQTP